MLYLQQQNIFLSEQAFGEYFLFPVIPDKFDCAQRVFKIYKKKFVASGMYIRASQICEDYTHIRRIDLSH
jgi:hypothetical protein